MYHSKTVRKSIAEQNSINVAWDLLMEPKEYKRTVRDQWIVLPLAIALKVSLDNCSVKTQVSEIVNSFRSQK